jgi:hypothetical protein
MIEKKKKIHFAVYSIMWPTRSEAAEDAWEAEALWTAEELKNMPEHIERVGPNRVPYNVTMMRPGS